MLVNVSRQSSGQSICGHLQSLCAVLAACNCFWDIGEGRHQHTVFVDSKFAWIGIQHDSELPPVDTELPQHRG